MRLHRSEEPEPQDRPAFAPSDSEVERDDDLEARWKDAIEIDRLADGFEARGEIDAAIRRKSEAVAAFRGVAEATGDPWRWGIVATTLREAAVLANRGSQEQKRVALAQVEEAVRIRNGHPDAGDPNWTWHHALELGCLAGFRNDAGMFTRALQDVQEAEAMLDALPDTLDPRLPIDLIRSACFEQRAHALMGLGRATEAITVIPAMIAHAAPFGDVETIRHLMDLAREICEVAGEPDQAAAWRAELAALDEPHSDSTAE